MVSSIMGAIREQESDGNYDAVNGDSGAFGAYQFMPDTWNDACSQFGLDPSDTSPDNQDKAAYNLMSKYYDQYQDPKAVAAMWYSGQPNYDIDEDEGNYPSITKYANQVNDRLSKYFQPDDSYFGNNYSNPYSFLLQYFLGG